MKYLKKFESIFEPDEPKQINQRDKQPTTADTVNNCTATNPK